jgi:hypothetical protein
LEFEISESDSFTTRHDVTAITVRQNAVQLRVACPLALHLSTHFDCLNIACDYLKQTMQLKATMGVCGDYLK